MLRLLTSTRYTFPSVRSQLQSDRPFTDPRLSRIRIGWTEKRGKASTGAADDFTSMVTTCCHQPHYRTMTQGRKAPSCKGRRDVHVDQRVHAQGTFRADKSACRFTGGFSS